MPNRLAIFLKNHFFLLITLAVTLLVFIKLVNYGHISWDDSEMVFKNNDVKEFNLSALLSNHYTGNYIPVTMLVHSINWFLFGSHDGAHHLINLLLHLINGILVFKLGQTIFNSKNVALTGMVIFLLHPAQVESIAWISELKNILSTLFYLCTLLLYFRYKNAETKTSYFLFFLFFLLSCLSKSSAVVLPLVMLAIDFFILKLKIKDSLLNKVPLLIFSVIFGIINLKAQSADLYINHSHEFAIYARFGLAGYALIKYALLFLFPFNLSVIYPYPPLKPALIITGYLALTCIATVLFYLFKHQKNTWLFALLFSLINLILVLQFIPFGEVLYADRYAYIPLIGFAWIIGMMLEKVPVYFKNTIRLSALFLILLSFFRCQVWSSGVNLYTDILRNHPNSFVALTSVGAEYMFQNDDKKALEYFIKSIKVSPENYKGHYNLGLLMIKKNRPKDAIESFNKSIFIFDYPKAYIGRATAYYMLGNLPNAMADANHVLNSDKNNAKAHFVLGNCYSEMNQLENAMSEYNTCLSLNNKEADYYFKKAIVFGKKQDFVSSLTTLDTSINLKPDLYEAYFWRGVAKANLKRNPCEDFKIAAQNNYAPAINAYNKYCNP